MPLTTYNAGPVLSALIFITRYRWKNRSTEVKYTNVLQVQESRKSSKPNLPGQLLLNQLAWFPPMFFCVLRSLVHVIHTACGIIWLSGRAVGGQMGKGLGRAWEVPCSSSCSLSVGAFWSCAVQRLHWVMSEEHPSSRMLPSRGPEEFLPLVIISGGWEEKPH